MSEPQDSSADPTVVQTPPGSAPSASTDEGPELGGRFGRYEIDRRLGRGGMGAVYLARQVDLDRHVVIKVIAPELARDDKIVERLHREARAAAKVSSDNVVKVHETGREGGVPFIAMEFIDGPSLAKVLDDRGRLPWVEATKIVLAVAEALRAAHEVGVLHRDVKPANVLLTKDGRVKVADFGLAKLERRVGDRADGGGSTLSVDGQILGTPEYMAPEQADGGTVDGRADIYALGVTYYELLTGVRPFRGKSPIQTISLALSAPVTPPRAHVPELPPAVERACLTLMARELEKRPASAAAAVEILEGILADVPASQRLRADPSLGRLRAGGALGASPSGATVPLSPASSGIANSASPGSGSRPPSTASGSRAPLQRVAVVRPPEAPSHAPLVAVGVLLAVTGLAVGIGVMRKLDRKNAVPAPAAKPDAPKPPASIVPEPPVPNFEPEPGAPTSPPPPPPQQPQPGPQPFPTKPTNNPSEREAWQCLQKALSMPTPQERRMGVEKVAREYPNTQAGQKAAEMLRNAPRMKGR